VVFFQPQIHWNTGNMGRTCLGLGARLHLVGPLGFSLDEKQVRRAGLDYWHQVDLRVYTDWATFLSECTTRFDQVFFFTKYASQSLLDVEFGQHSSDSVVALVFGSETEGLTGIGDYVSAYPSHCVALPMVDPQVFRSFNLSTSASIALWEAFKQMRTHVTKPNNAALGSTQP